MFEENFEIAGKIIGIDITRPNTEFALFWVDCENNAVYGIEVAPNIYLEQDISLSDTFRFSGYTHSLTENGVRTYYVTKMNKE